MYSMNQVNQVLDPMTPIQTRLAALPDAESDGDEGSMIDPWGGM